MSLRAKIDSALWVLGPQAVMVLLKLMSIYVLSRVLDPEAYGAILIVMSIFTLIELMSDVGLRGSVINNPRGESDPAFVNTIWTLKVIRGVLIAGVLLLISTFAHLIYPDVEHINDFMCIAAFNAFILGFASTKLHQMERQMQMMRPALMQIFVRAAALLCTIQFAKREPSAAAILWGESVAAMATVLLSHGFLQGTRNAFFIEKNSLSVVFNYGKWIFLATLLTWGVQEGNKLLLGVVMGLQILGFYSMAWNISSFVKTFLTQFANRWTFPMYATLIKSPALDITALRIRLVIVLFAGLSVVILGGFSNLIVEQFLDERYVSVAPFITIIAIGSIGLIVSDCYMPIFKANADSFGLLKMRFSQTLILGLCLFVGWKLRAVEGIVIGAAFGQLIMGPVTAFCARVHFKKKRYLFDSVVYVLPFLIWLVFDINLLTEVCHEHQNCSK